MWKHILMLMVGVTITGNVVAYADLTKGTGFLCYPDKSGDYQSHQMRGFPIDIFGVGETSQSQYIRSRDTDEKSFDSLNVRFIGNWPFGPSFTVAYDSLRNICFCGSGGGVYILNLQNPYNPQKLSEDIHRRGIVYSLFYKESDSILYVTARESGLELWDVKNTSLPIKLGYYDTPGRAYAVAVSGSYAYVADGGAGLRVIDISTPSSPTEVGYYETPGSARGVAVVGSYAYVANWGAGLRVIDISTPSSPTEVGYYDTPGGANAVTVSGSYAYIADDYAGLRVIDISTPSSPTEVGYYDTPSVM